MSIVTQMIIQLFKTRRQVNYQAVEESNRGMYQNIETPLSVGLGLYIHQRTRSKELLDMFSEMNLSISSKKVACIKRDIETAVKEKVHDSDGIFIPSTISPSNDVYTAVDNTDMRIDTADGQHQLHGTAMALYQKETGLPADNSTQIINRSSRLEKRATPFYESQFCPESKRENVKYNSYTEFVTHDYFEQLKKKDLIWSLLKPKLDMSLKVPTWAAYNSLTTKKQLKIVYCSLPVLNGSPTNWSNLYSAFKIVQGINVSKCEGRKTIVSMDLQLYAKCLQSRLQSRKEISDDFVFRLGELHTVFAMLKSIGKYIDNSGLDQAFIEAEIYGNATIEQIKGGKHMKRSFEAFQRLYVTLFQLYIEELIKTNPIIEKGLRGGIIDILVSIDDNTVTNDFNDIQRMSDVLAVTDFLEVQQCFDYNLKYQAKFLRNIMKMFEILLLFVRGTRQSCWELHLTSLDSFVKYFFVHDLQNYASYSPIYLAQMYKLRENEKTWNFLNEGNFSVNKSDVPFCAIGADHALEQENRRMKVLGGIKGMANKQTPLDQHFLIYSEMNSVLDGFYRNLHLNVNKDHRDVH